MLLARCPTIIHSTSEYDFYFGSPAFQALEACDLALGFGLSRRSGNEDFFFRLTSGAHYTLYTEDRTTEYGDGVACDLASALNLLEERIT